MNGVLSIGMAIGRRKSRYPGQYQLEVLSAATAYELSDYPSLLTNAVFNQNRENWECVGIVTLLVSEKEVLKQLAGTPPGIVAEIEPCNTPSES